MAAALPNLVILPVLHGRLEFAVAVRQALLAVQPDCIAVELPETLEGPVLLGVRRLPLLSVVQYLDGRGRKVYLPIEPADPVIEALRFALEQGIQAKLVDQDIDRYGRHRDHVPDSYAVRRLGYERYCSLVLEHLPEEPDPVDAGREAVMAANLAQLCARHQRVVMVCGLSHVRGLRRALDQPPGAEPLRRRRRDGVTLYHLGERSSREVMAEPAYLSVAFERARAESSAAALDSLDRLAEQLRLCQAARTVHQKNQGEEVSTQALAVLCRYARNYALVEGRLAADIYQLLVAARGAVDDNYAYEVWDLGTRWPHQSDAPGLPVLELGIEDLFAGARTFRFHRTQKHRRRTLLRLVKDRPKEAFPGQWQEGWRGESICSYQPEDLHVESYGDFLKHKAQGLLSAERVRVEPFTTSLLDGIDIRETLRNWHEHRLYVREQQSIRGEVGSVIVIFDEDRGASERYPYCITWQGEHEQESDMALYATPLGEKFVGPGISRCEYGGFLLSYPPGRMFGVFQDPLFERAETKPERLLMAGIAYSEKRLVVYAAASPPRSAFRSMAERFGRKVVYIPLADLSPITLKKLRVFHVLDGHPVRGWASEYIGRA